jgi:creatinine deaminase
MLVLARQRGETIVIGEDIEVTVVDVRGDKVRLGVNAPRTVQVHRKEIYEQIKAANQAAAQMRPADLPGNIAAAGQDRADYPRLAKENSTMDPFLRAAIEEAQKGLSEGGLPIGSVLVRDGKIIGRGHNRRVQHGDPMAHAEIDCLKNAGRQKTYRDTVLYSTLMPCYLCSGAAVQFGIPKVVVGESVNFHGGESTLAGHTCGKSPEFMRSAGIEVVDLADPECIEMMRKFIAEHPELWNEDIGR